MAKVKKLSMAAIKRALQAAGETFGSTWHTTEGWWVLIDSVGESYNSQDEAEAYRAAYREWNKRNP